MTNEFVMYREGYRSFRDFLRGCKHGVRGPFYTIEADSMEEAEEIFRSFYRKPLFLRLLHRIEHWQLDRLVEL